MSSRNERADAENIRTFSLEGGRISTPHVVARSFANTGCHFRWLVALVNDPPSLVQQSATLSLVLARHAENGEFSSRAFSRIETLRHPGV